MGKSLKDYARYCRGCQVVFPQLDEGCSAKLISVNTVEDTVSVYIDDACGRCFDDDFIVHVDYVKLLLRPLSYLREDELRNAVDPMAYGLSSLRGDNALLQAAEMTHYLVSKYYDVFGLIAAGLALDITKINTDGK